MEKLVLVTVSSAVLSTASFSSVAGIIHQDLNIDLGVSSVMNSSASEDNYVDINGDGNNDFRFRNYEQLTDRTVDFYSSYSYERSPYYENRDRNLLQTWGLGGLEFTNSPLSENATIDENSIFTTYQTLVDYNDYYRGSYQSRSRYRSCGRWSCSYGSWREWTTTPEYDNLSHTGSWVSSLSQNSFTGYMGFRMADGNGAFNYGWLSLSIDDRGEGSLNSFAFNESADESITAGQTRLANSKPTSVSEPATLALMVLGAGAIGAIRRKKKQDNNVS